MLNNAVNLLHILIVEDSLTDRELLKARLKTLGHIVITAENGEQAIALLSEKDSEIDLVLLDVDMPYISGYQVAERVRKVEEENNIEWRPIIFLSGFDTPQDIARGIEAGGDDFLIKPVNNIILSAKITAMQRIADMRNQLLEVKKVLEYQAQIDELTQIYNRRHFLYELDREMARSKRYGNPMTVIYFDIDHFKKVNDTRGHEAGDIVLKQVSRTLKSNLRSEDILGRMGGEEFCLCLPELTLQQSLETCERYRKLIENLPHTSAGESFYVTASFGLTQFNSKSDDEKSLLSRADQALYEAKHSGRNCIRSI